MEILTILAVMLSAMLISFACIWCYRQGIRDGRSIKADEPLESLAPSITKHQKPSKEAKAKNEAIQEMMEYDGSGYEDKRS